MSDVEALKIILRAEVDQAISDLKKASREGKNAEKDWNGISKSFQSNIKHSLSLKNAFSQLSMQVAGGIAIYQLAGKAIQAIGKFASDSVKETTEAAEGHARLEAQLRATGGAAGFTVDELEDMARELQRVTKIEDDEIRDAQSTLLKFTSITGEEYKKATALALDYSRVTGGDASSAAQTLGQALEDPIAGFGKLRKAGVMLSDEEESLAKQFIATGEAAKAKGVLLKALEDRVGGVAKAVGGADPAGMKRLGIAMKDAKDQAGEFISKGISPATTALASYIEKAVEATRVSKEIQAAMRGEGSVDTISAALSNEKKRLEELKAGLGGADIWQEEQIKRDIKLSELKIATLQENLKRIGQATSAVQPGTGSPKLSEADSKAIDHIKTVNEELKANIETIKTRAEAMGKEASAQDLLNAHIDAYTKIVNKSNGLVSSSNPAALALREKIEGYDRLVEKAKEYERAILAMDTDSADALSSQTYGLTGDEIATQRRRDDVLLNEKARFEAAILAMDTDSADALSSQTYGLTGDEIAAQRRRDDVLLNEKARFEAAILAMDTDSADALSSQTYGPTGDEIAAQRRRDDVLLNEKARFEAAILAMDTDSADALSSQTYGPTGADIEEQRRRDDVLLNEKARFDAAILAMDTDSGDALSSQTYGPTGADIEEQRRRDDVLLNEKARFDAAILAMDTDSADALSSQTYGLTGDEIAAQRQRDDVLLNEKARFDAAILAMDTDSADALSSQTYGPTGEDIEEQRRRDDYALNEKARFDAAVLALDADSADAISSQLDISNGEETLLKRFNNTREAIDAQNISLLEYAKALRVAAIASGDTSGKIEKLDAIISELQGSLGVKGGLDSKKFFEDLKKEIKDTALSLASSGIYDTLSAIGGAMASGESSANAFGAAMKQFFASALQQTSMLALNAGLRLIVEGGLPMLPVAIGLLALGGVSAIAAGAISSSGQVREVDYDQYIIDPVIAAETDLAKMRINLIEDQLEKERDLRDENLKKIEQQFDLEFSVLEDQWERGLISTQDFKSQAAALRENEAVATTEAEAPVKAAEDMIDKIEAARIQKLSVLSTRANGLQDKLNAMSGWDKFWSGNDEKYIAQLNILDDRIQAVKSAKSLPEISAAKYGADFITSGARLLKVGDNPGGRERVRVEPIGTPNRYGPSGESIIIQINAPVYGVDDLYRKLEEAGKKLKRGGRSPVGVFG